MNVTRLAIIGRSSTGKDAVASLIMKQMGTNNCSIMKMYTTREQRNENDTNYDFVSAKEFFNLVNTGEIIEIRKYDILKDGKEIPVWYGYGRKHLLQEKKMLLMPSATFDCIHNIHNSELAHLPITVLYVYSDKKDILLRSVERESTHDVPNYSEVCNRFLLDEKQFGDIDNHLESMYGDEYDANVFYKNNKSGFHTVMSYFKIITYDNDIELQKLTHCKKVNVIRNFGDRFHLEYRLKSNLEKLRDPNLSTTGV